MPTEPERRSSERVPLVRTCSYELSIVRGAGSMELSQGQAFSVNVSSRGMLLLMSQAPQTKQVLEVQAPSEAGEKTTLKVAEVRWTSPVQAGDEGTMHLVGVRFLFEPPAGT